MLELGPRGMQDMEVEQTSTGVAGDRSPVMLVTTLLVGFAAWLWWYRWSQRDCVTPKTWPVVGILLEFAGNWNRIHDWMTDYLYKAATFRAYMGFGFYFLVSVDPANMEHIMKTNFANYPKGSRLTGINHDFFGQGIFNADGDLWIHQRKVAAMELAPIRLRTFKTHVFAEYATRLAHRILDKSKSSEQFDMQELVTRMTLDSTVRTAFGVDLGSLAPDLPVIPVSKNFDTANEYSFLRFTHPFWKMERFFQLGEERKLKKSVSVLDAFAYDLIQRRRKEMPDGQLTEQVNEEKDDLLSRLVKISKQGDSRFGDRALRDITVNYIIAGKDTTSAAICWAIYMLATHPHVCDKVRQELAELERLHSSPGKQDHQFEEEAIQAFVELLNFDNVGSLTYLHATLTESIRLYPPAPLNAKQAIEDDMLPDGSIVKKGDLILIHAYSMGRMPSVWGLDAAEFKPERWIENGTFQPKSNFKYIAFQGGPRLCLGKDSAFLQSKITLALLTQFFDFQLVPQHKYTYKAMLPLNFLDGLVVTVSKRKI